MRADGQVGRQGSRSADGPGEACHYLPLTMLTFFIRAVLRYYCHYYVNAFLGSIRDVSVFVSSYNSDKVLPLELLNLLN